MKHAVFLCVFIGVLSTLALARLNSDNDGFDVDRENAVEFLKRTIFHPGKTKCEEQKREASEKYEERCEPSINKLTGSRYCPDIKTWDAFKNYETNSGYGR
ncbi:unnamed protein product [Rotaria magnacalcarata]|uniref:Uncharacterized protein n=3 Tax=Rotaria magnacalcarata TaxID=392030 RepID=A0A819Q8X7_9BILA|nr:unnamed protein product [Rotaria magnacalcarata]CAF2089248.1 unnamed protein product [Rotaria magnacalcarata]CAF2139044.1 unnamed protein product [Rotaria magnacalcarata]CAF3983774.1 unnamed protein product [Rotaria magnacalcarata]CAF3999653.1 unnamed protein product [Rotaria magnacalcarata]